MIHELIKKHAAHMIALREELHRHPEIEFDLPKTHALVKKELEAIGLDVRTGFASTGLIGILHGGKPGKTVMLRADMDALPVLEQADVPYKSQEEGRMHACGHDGHTAALIGAAAALTEMKDEIPGSIMFLFQPAEEAKYGGAEVMIKDGVMDVMPIDASFSGHLWGSIPRGEIHIKSGVTMASRDEFKLHINGRGGHGAMPQFTIDPVIIAAEIINAIQTIVSRSVDPNEPAVISVCQLFTPDGAPNIIPDYVEMTGTVRAYNEDVRTLLLARLEQIIKCICDAHNTTYELTAIGGCPEMVNDPAMTELALESARKVVGAEHTVALQKPLAGSEDFSLFCKAVPSCYAFIGINEGKPIAHHNPSFAWTSEALLPLSEFLATVALDYLKK